MNNSHKAMIWSAFVFPGAGQIVLKQKKKGFLFAALAFCCTIALFVIIIKFTLSDMESKAFLGEAITLSSFFKSVLFSLFLAKKFVLPPLVSVWAISILDAWQIGKVLDK